MKKPPKFLTFSPLAIGEEEIREVTKTLRSGWITTGPKTHEFEERFREFVNARAALAVNSCTSALHLALVVLKIGPGDEVITSPMTFCSAVNIIEHVGAKPVFADVEPDTLNINPGQIAKLLKSKMRRKKIKAIVATHYAGHPCEMDEIMALGHKYGIPVIEDAAHALPASYKEKKIGSIGNFTAFSFYATKNLTTAEGGMLVSQNLQNIKQARILSLHGMDRDAWNRYGTKGSWAYKVVTPGFKYNLTDIQSSLGIVQLKKLLGFQKRRREIVRQYQHNLEDCNLLQLPVERSHVEHAWHLYPVRLDLKRIRITRGQFIEALKRRGIGASVHFIPVHLQPYYRDKYGFKPEDYPVAFQEYQRLVSLPLSPALDDADVKKVLRAVETILRTGPLKR